MERQNRFVKDYVQHLPEVRAEDMPNMLSKPGVSHMVCYHDEKCPIYDGKACNCDPDVRYFAEPMRA
jgi:hypothetical protein